MATETRGDDVGRLNDALNRFDWDTARAICESVISRIWKAPDAIDETSAGQMLADLRRKRRFPLLERLAEALVLAGRAQPTVLRQYAQALIDQGRYAAAEHVLRALLAEADPTEHGEALGLIGRVYKQLYVNPGALGVPGQPRFLLRAIAEYRRAYQIDPSRYVWQGLNVVALLARAVRDGVAVPHDFPTVPALARQVLDSLDRRDAARPEGQSIPAFDVATRLEAHVALGDYDRAVAIVSDYVRCADADAFELASTERQLREVWQLDASPNEAGPRLLAILRAMLLARQGGQVTLDSAERRSAAGAAASPLLEAILGHDTFQTLAWYRQGLDCCSGIVRLETRLQQGFGTGWMTDGGSLSNRWAGTTVVVTNKHVVSARVNGETYRPQPGRKALLPAEAVIFHEMSNTRLPVTDDDLLWTSPDLTLDATILHLRRVPDGARPLTLSEVPVELADPPDRVYVIGHPAGRGLEFSLHDNVMLACDTQTVHYRAPTEGGSSGSPVFDASWRVIALHHAGGKGVPRLTGEGHYDANEGVAISAIREAIARVVHGGA